jgi:hypothetical protein
MQRSQMVVEVVPAAVPARIQRILKSDSIPESKDWEIAAKTLYTLASDFQGNARTAN